MLEYRNWMETFRTAFPFSYNVNERTEFANKGSPTGKLFPPQPRYGERIIDTRTWSKIRYQDLSAHIQVLFNFLKKCFFK